MKITTSTGKVLDNEAGFCNSIRKWAIYKKVENLEVFWDEEAGKYLLVDITDKQNPTPIFMGNFEECSVHIDIMAIAEEK